MSDAIIIRGGGDLASGVALRLYRCGLKVVITELPQPQVVRRWVSFAEAIYSGKICVEGVIARRAASPAEALSLLEQGIIPVLVDPQAEVRYHLPAAVLVDGRMVKNSSGLGINSAPLVIGMGPGFEAGVDCHAVVETNRGHEMGRVIWQGKAEDDTGIPESVRDFGAERVLRAPAGGIFETRVEIGDVVEAEQVVAEVESQPLKAPFRGLVRGLLHPGLLVQQGLKVGDIDPRTDPRISRLVSDKSLAVGGGVLEAILTRADLRPRLWD